MNTTYLRLELLRVLRNRQSFIFSLIFPVLMLLIFGAPNRHDDNFGGSGINGATYYMIGMLTFGSVGAVIAGGMRIAVDRAIGWNRQLRLSPLTPRAYLTAKVLVGYVTAGMTIAVLYLVGASLGARMSAVHWLETTALVLIGLVPFAAIGIWAGHTFKEEAMGPLMGGAMSLFAIVGGSWFPVSGIIGTIGSWTPSYWIVQAGHLGVGGTMWPVKGWVVILAWTLAFSGLATRAYAEDTKRG
ncbi:ABC transporter permease [Jatrophihabitans telluris]|uniref:ABC transporter permease n=1 Tax=Jatrophihabitans telluris TaxID=2038343 RepID=A0ABY4QZJ1_9ACTN|nr:ABC transporter permease [Jatrophihabitans telluris]UQX88928.1 ABC transporter permease [Jatrophihabitans telluris]